MLISHLYAVIVAAQKKIWNDILQDYQESFESTGFSKPIRAVLSLKSQKSLHKAFPVWSMLVATGQGWHNPAFHSLPQSATVFRGFWDLGAILSYYTQFLHLTAFLTNFQRQKWGFIRTPAVIDAFSVSTSQLLCRLTYIHRQREWDTQCLSEWSCSSTGGRIQSNLPKIVSWIPK